MLTSQKSKPSALGLQKMLGLGSHQTGWSGLHRVGHATVDPGRDRLLAYLEVDDAYIGGEQEGKRGRGSENKVLVVIVVKVSDSKIGWVSISCIANACGDSLWRYEQKSVEKGSTVNTDGRQRYTGLSTAGYVHEATIAKHTRTIRVSAACAFDNFLDKRCLLETHQGTVGNKHLDYYLDKYAFRFNKRVSQYRGKLFCRLIQNAVMEEPVTHNSIISKVDTPY